MAMTEIRLRREGYRGRRTRRQPRGRGGRAEFLLALVLAGPLPAFAAATDEAPEGPKEGDTVPVVGREDLIGKLVPITGDPLEVRSVHLRVEFRKNSAELTESAVAQLRELGAALVSEALVEVPIGVYGHTDASGPADYNRKLSARRAEAVAGWLREQFAVPEPRIREVLGFGEERPREDLPPGDPAQRRVEIVTFHPYSGRAPDEEPATPRRDAPQGGDGVVVTVPGGDVSPERAPKDEDDAAKKGGGDSGMIVIQ